MGKLIHTNRDTQETETDAILSGRERDGRIYGVIKSLRKMGDYSSITELLNPNGSMELTHLEQFADYLREDHYEAYEDLVTHGCLRGVA